MVVGETHGEPSDRAPEEEPEEEPEANVAPGEAALRGARATKVYCALGGGGALLVCWIFWGTFSSMKAVTLTFGVLGSAVLASAAGLEVAAFVARLRARIARRRGMLIEAARIEEFAFAAAPRARRRVRLKTARVSAVVRPEAEFEDHPGGVVAIAFDSGSETFATGGEDGHVVVRRLADGGESRVHEFGEPVGALVFRPDAKALAVGTKTGEVHLLRLEDGGSERTLNQSYRVIALAYDRYDALIAATTSRGLVFLPRGEDKPMVNLNAAGDEVTSAAFDARGDRLVAGTSSGNVSVWDVRGDPFALAQFGQGGRARSVTISDDGRLVAVFGGLGLAVWQVNPFLRLGAPTVDEDVSGLAFGPGSETVLVATRKSVRVLSLPKLDGIRHLEADAYRILVTAMSPDGRTVVAGAADGKVCVWRLAEE